MDSNRNQGDMEELIPRLPKSEMLQKIPYNIEIARYTGPKKLTPPKNSIKVKVPTLATLAQTAILLNRARERDLAFFKNVYNGDPEHSGYNTKRTREEGLSLQPKTRAIYLPLIDMPPAEYETIPTSMLQIKRLTEATGQLFALLTLDQQLYRYAVEIQWALPEVFPASSFILRLGGMHMLMSFIGAVRNLMTETGLADIMSAAFAGVHQMLIGKKFPMCMRALRMVVEVILEPTINDHSLLCYDTFLSDLEIWAECSKTCRLWLDCLIKPVFLMMAYIRAEREGDWLLRVYCVKSMMPYFFAAGHHNYARSGLAYLRAIEKNILPYFLKGKHVMRHMKGLWNGICSDMFNIYEVWAWLSRNSWNHIETRNPQNMGTSRHICSQLMEDLTELRGESVDSRTATKKKHLLELQATRKTEKS